MKTFLFFLLVLPCFLCAQQPIEQHLSTSYQSNATHIYPLPDSTYLIGGVESNGAKYFNLFFSKVDKNGTMLWKKNIKKGNRNSEVHFLDIHIDFKKQKIYALGSFFQCDITITNAYTLDLDGNLLKTVEEELPYPMQDKLIRRAYIPTIRQANSPYIIAAIHWKQDSTTIAHIDTSANLIKDTLKTVGTDLIDLIALSQTRYLACFSNKVILYDEKWKELEQFYLKSSLTTTDRHKILSQFMDSVYFLSDQVDKPLLYSFSLNADSSALNSVSRPVLTNPYIFCSNILLEKDRVLSVGKSIGEDIFLHQNAILKSLNIKDLSCQYSPYNVAIKSIKVDSAYLIKSSSATWGIETEAVFLGLNMLVSNKGEIALDSVRLKGAFRLAVPMLCEENVSSIQKLVLHLQVNEERMITFDTIRVKWYQPSGTTKTQITFAVMMPNGKIDTLPQDNRSSTIIALPTLIVAVKEGLEHNSLRFYPNPIEQTLCVAHGIANSTILIFNQLGQKIQQFETTDAENQCFELPDLAQGVYFYQYVDNTKQTVVKKGKWIKL